MHFTSPFALILILLIPIAAWIGKPGHGFGRQLEIVSLAVRIVILLCVVLSLAGLTWKQPGDKLAVVFLLDRSDSMPEATQLEAIDYIEQALAAMQIDDQAALIVFGGDALVERSMSSNSWLDPILSIPTSYQTDLEQAIRLGMAIFPSNAARRMVILTDGIETTGNGAEAVRLAAASGIEVLVISFQNTLGDEALLSQVDLPSVLAEGERFSMEITIEATTPTPALLRISSRGEILYEGNLQIRRGEQRLSLPFIAGIPGLTDYQVQLIPEDDTYYQNNELSAFSEVTGSPRILIVAPRTGESFGYAGESRPDEYSNLSSALQSTDFTVDMVSPGSLPLNLSELVRYAAVMLVDVPARQLNQQQMDTLHTYVRDLGGGLVTVGGPTSYGVGGYFHTPLEEMLPVDILIHDQQRRPSLAMVFIIDRSGSMSESSTGVTKLQLAQEAAIRSVELLYPTDRVGVIAFDDTASWVVPMTDLDYPEPILSAIGSIHIGGGTDILSGIEAMAAVLPDDPALVKHVILLTDGGADPTGIPELVSLLYKNYGITLSTIGVGSDAARYLEELAKLGGGRYSFTTDPSTIPAIFTEETTLMTRAYIIEETTYPELHTASPILTGIDLIPPLAGYIGTSSRETAQTILVSQLGDPILAAWQYGLGRVVSFTSDATSRWAQAWITLEGFPVFWSQAVEYTINRQLSIPLQVQITQEGENAYVLVEAMETSFSESGIQINYLNGYQMQANLITPTGDATILNLNQEAPGQYQAAFRPTEQGVYILQVKGTPPLQDSPALSTTTGWVLGYSPEYQTFHMDSKSFFNNAIAMGGKYAADNPEDVFEQRLESPPTQKPIWPWLLTAAACLLPVDIAIRRLVISKDDLLRAWSKLNLFIVSRKSARQQEPHPNIPVTQGLLITKARVRKQRLPQESDEGHNAIEQVGQPAISAPVKTPIDTKVGKEGQDPNLAQRTQDLSSESTASHLLTYKRSRQEKKASGKDNK
jgi:Mg-chelatase subunit ChlD